MTISLIIAIKRTKINKHINNNHNSNNSDKVPDYLYDHHPCCFCYHHHYHRHHIMMMVFVATSFALAVNIFENNYKKNYCSYHCCCHYCFCNSVMTVIVAISTILVMGVICLMPGLLSFGSCSGNPRTLHLRINVRILISTHIRWNRACLGPESQNVGSLSDHDGVLSLVSSSLWSSSLSSLFLWPLLLF